MGRPMVIDGQYDDLGGKLCQNIIGDNRSAITHKTRGVNYKWTNFGSGFRNKRFNAGLRSVDTDLDPLE